MVLNVATATGRVGRYQVDACQAGVPGGSEARRVYLGGKQAVTVDSTHGRWYQPNKRLLPYRYTPKLRVPKFRRKDNLCQLKFCTLHLTRRDQIGFLEKRFLKCCFTAIVGCNLLYLLNPMQRLLKVRPATIKVLSNPNCDLVILFSWIDY